MSAADCWKLDTSAMHGSAIITDRHIMCAGVVRIAGVKQLQDGSRGTVPTDTASHKPQNFKDSLIRVIGRVNRADQRTNRAKAYTLDVCWGWAIKEGKQEVDGRKFSGLC